MVLFHGYFDNCTAVAAELQANAADHAHLYGLAVERWGDEADTRIIGEYCAVIADPDQHHLRLSRSPLRAPPLCYFHDERLAAAASVPRALFAVGVDQKLSDRRIGDTALVNFTDREDSWFEGIRRVPTGAIVELQRGRERTLRTYYDLFALPDVRMGSDAEYLARAGELLDEGVRACLAGFKRPGTTLSAGLDTPQVAARTLAALPEDQRLPSFTFHPEDGYDGREEPLTLGNERPFVERFAAMHPRLEPHFTANEGYGHDHRWNDFFHLMSGAPTGLSNMYVFHGIFAEAVKAGCDVLLLAEWGNYTFSDKGDWGYVEYFLKGNFRQWWRAISSLSRDDRSLPAHIAARTLSALLPRSLWKLGKRLYRRGGQSLLDLMQPLSPQFRESSGADSRLKASGWEIERYQPWNRRHAQRLLFQMDDAEAAEIYQAFEQMYGVAQRDPMAYRPFVEFCFGLPVKMFMRDGIVRWMAKEMAKGIMPEEQRANAANGRWDADWHLRIGRQRQAYLAELDRLEADERIGPMLDIPRLRANLVDWPDQTEVDPQQVYGREFAVPRALLIARFVRYIEGRNDG
ncbi:MAG: asparagine synthase C-terminal domain-containing protein [Sphingomicrobium sp.]